VRKCLREIVSRVVFPVGEPWERHIEQFAIAALERVKSGWSQNPWFCVTGWLAVIEVAAIDFFSDVGTPLSRQLVASNATAAHFNALLMCRAIKESDSKCMLPNPALLDLQALGINTLPAMPDQKNYPFPTTGSGKEEAWL